MSYASCPSAVVNAPVDVVWALLTTPAGWGDVFDMRLLGVEPAGPAAVGQVVHGETGPGLLHLKLMFRILEIDQALHHLRMDVRLPLGLAVREDLRCTSLDDTHCRIDYRCEFSFPTGWRAAAIRHLVNRRLDSGPEDSLHRLKRAAERRFTEISAGV